MAKKELLELHNAETISENIDARKVANYGYDLANTQWRRLAVDSVGAMVTSGLVPTAYDYISLSYTDTDLTGVVYKTGGSTGTTVATLTLAYTAHVLQTITRT